MSRKDKYRKAKRTKGERKTDNQEIKTYNTNPDDKRMNVDDPDSIQKLREMANKGEFPEFIDATSREARERFYEEFNKLYPDPPGILNDYRVEPNGRSSAFVYFNYNLAEAESPGNVSFPSRHSSEAVKQGAIKHAIYKQRSAVEYALSSRLGGFSSYDLAQKYGGRVVSKAERAQADKKIISQVERLLGSPMTRRGLQMNATDWKEQDGGYFRIGTERFATQRG